MNSKKELRHQLHVNIYVRNLERILKVLGDVSLQESGRSGRPPKIDYDVLRSMLENNPRLTSREFVEEFAIHHTTIGDHIKSLGFVLKQSVWVPHELTEKNLSDRVEMCSLNVTLNLEHHQQNSQKTKQPSTKRTDSFVVGQGMSRVLRVAETGKTNRRGSYQLSKKKRHH